VKVLLTTDSYKPNIDGAAIFAQRLAKGLQRKGVQMEIVAPHGTLRSRTEVEDGVKVHYQPAWKPIDSLGMVIAINPAIRTVIRRFRPDVIHINLPYTTGLATLRTAKRFGIPMLATNHVVLEGVSWAVPSSKAIGDTVEDAFRKYLLWFYRQCDLVTVPTEEAARMLLGDSGENLPLEVVSNGVDLDLFKPRPASDADYAEFGLPNKPLVLYAGRFEVEKSLDVWLRAAALVRKEVDAHFVLAGSGTMRDQLAALAQELDIAQHVSIVGPLTSERLARLHNLATVFLICSTTESQSIATLEAGASGLPVVGVKAAALVHLIKEGENGLLAPPDDEREIARSTIKLLGNADMRRAFGAESRRVAAGHSLDRAVDNYRGLYEGLVTKSRRAVA
jgi:1,2-diacylglycerol 3-alpha-glucosyltransferase